MERVRLSATKRSVFGKGYASRLRREGFIPAIIYGHSKENIPVKISAKMLRKVLAPEAGKNVIIDIAISDDGKESIRTVILKEKQLHPIRREVLHVDFYEISLAEELVVKVPLKISGEAPGVRNGGVLEHCIREVEVRCLPTSIPDYIQVDISGLEIGDIIHLRDLESYEGVKILGDEEQVVLVITAPRVEEKEEAIAPEVAEPEVISRKREEELKEE